MNIKLSDNNTNYITAHNVGQYSFINRRKVRTIASNLSKEIEKRLKNCVFYYMTSWRVKENSSIKKKLKNKGNENYKIQDLIGIRIILFFSDDVEIVSNHLLKDFNCVKQKNMVSRTNPYLFTNNYAYTIPNAWLSDLEMAVQNPNIDTTFEVQIRTINSEAWQELDHDYIYKQQGSKDKEQLEIYFKSIGTSYKGIEDNILAFYGLWQILQKRGAI